MTNPQPTEGQEHRRTHAKDDVVVVLRQLFLPDFHALGIGKLRVVDSQPMAEDAR